MKTQRGESSTCGLVFGIIKGTDNPITCPSIWRRQLFFYISKHCPYFFANNNTNYARWLLFHWRDMLTLEQRHHILHHDLMPGKFVVFMSKRPFSSCYNYWSRSWACKRRNNIWWWGNFTYQMMCQLNGGECSLAWYEVSRLVAEYESLAYAKDANEIARHYEQTGSAQSVFFENERNESLPGRDKWLTDPWLKIHCHVSCYPNSNLSSSEWQNYIWRFHERFG